MPEWYEEFFDDRYLLFCEDAVQAGADAEEIEFIDRALGLEVGSRVINLGCGFGRHSIPLAARKYDVVGVDASQRMLDAGVAIAERLGVRLSWVRRDMREISEIGSFDACVCLYTAFGYFEDEENTGVLRGIHSIVRPGGVLLLDVNNPLCLGSRLPEERWSEAPRGIRRERHDFEPMTGRFIGDRTMFVHGGGRVNLPRSSVRLYAPYELARMFRETGWEVEQLHGGLHGAPFHWKRSISQSWVLRRR